MYVPSNKGWPRTAVRRVPEKNGTAIEERGKAPMKKVLSVCLMILLLIGCLTVSPAMAEDSAITNSVDIVVLVDMSKSMDTSKSLNNKTGSDPNGYRLDAMEMLTAMCDVNGSRVLYVPFGGTVLTGKDARRDKLKADTGFQDISSLNNRKDYITRIEADKTFVTQDRDNLETDTDYGEALRYAVEKISNRSANDHNQPMIVLLTDGANYFSQTTQQQNRTTRFGYTWNAAAKEWERNANPGYTAASADALADAATQACVQLGIPVYTVYLKDDRATGQEQVNQEKASAALAKISQATGGTTIVVPSSSADELPSYFGQIFADRIGGSMQRNLPIRRDANGNSYVNIPILNKSIQEINILLPMRYVDRNSIQLTDGNGRTVNVNSRQDVSVLYGAENSPFRLFKITNPQSLGIWTLKFKLSSGAALNTKVSLGVVFNYNLSLRARIGKEAAGMSTADTLRMSKNDTLFVEALFTDNRTEQLTDDLALYQKMEDLSLPANTAEDWWVIKATCSIYRENSDVPVSQRLTNTDIPSDGTRFYAEIPMGLEAGNYRLEIKVEGAGLSRLETRRLELTNSAPVANSLSETYYVDYVDNANLQPGAQRGPNIKIQLDGLLDDEDNDRLTLTLVPPAGDADFNTALLVNPRITEDGTNHYFEATIAGRPGSYQFGEYRQQIHVSDNQGGDADMELTFHVQSGIETAKAGEFASYLLSDGSNQKKQLEAEGTESSVGKKVNITQYVEYSRPNDSDATVRLQDFDIQLVLTNEQGAMMPSGQPLPLAMDGTAQKVSFATPQNEGTWTGTWTVSYLGQEIKSYSYAVKIENQKPQIADKLGTEVEKQVAFNELPSFLGFLNAVEGNTPEEELKIDLTRVFSDEDDEPAFSVRINDGVHADEAAARPEVKDGRYLIITPQAEGDVSFTVTAEDADHASVARTYKIHVKDLTKMWVIRGLIALAALIALIVLILIVHQIRKPVFKQVRLGVREGTSLYDSLEYDLPPTKKAWPMSYVVDSTTASKFSIPDVTLQNLMMEPTRSQDGTIKVSNRKPVGTVQITLEGNPVGKHAVRWSPGQALEMRATPNAVEFLHIVLSYGDNTADYAQSSSASDAFDFGGTPEFSGNFGVPDGFDVTSASNYGAATGGGFGASSGSDFGGSSAGGSDSFDFGSSSNSSDSDF